MRTRPGEPAEIAMVYGCCHKERVESFELRTRPEVDSPSQEDFPIGEGGDGWIVTHQYPGVMSGDKRRSRSDAGPGLQGATTRHNGGIVHRSAITLAFKRRCIPASVVVRRHDSHCYPSSSRLAGRTPRRSRCSTAITERCTEARRRNAAGRDSAPVECDGCCVTGHLCRLQPVIPQIPAVLTVPTLQVVVSYAATLPGGPGKTPAPAPRSVKPQTVVPHHRTALSLPGSLPESPP